MVIVSDKSNIAPTGIPITLDIKLMPQPAAKTIWYDNVTFYVAVIGLTGVIFTVALGWWRMKKELALALTLAKDARNYSKQQAEEDRNLAMDQANAERKHSADEAHRERIATARRAVYLDAAKEVIKARAVLGGLPMKKIGEGGADEGLNDLSVAVAQITILGGMDTVLKSREVLCIINLVYFKALAMSVPMSIKKDSISTFIAKRDAAGKSAANMQEKFEELTRVNGYTDEAAELAEKSRILHDQAVEYANSVLSEHEDFTRQQYNYIDFIIKEIAEIQKGTDELIIMIRRELELATDSDALFESTVNMHSLVQKAADELRTTLEKV